MALQYFLYNTNFGNTIVDRSNTSFTPITPYEEIYIDFFIPETQPLYLYANSGGTGGTIIVNSQENIDNYLDSIIPAPTADSNVTYGEFSGATAVLENYTGNGIVSGFVVSRNELDSGLTSINISSGIGYIIDNYTNPEKPIRTKLEFSGQTGITIQYIASGLTTYIAIDSGSTIIQKQTEFTPDERRDYIILGIVIHTNLTIINTVNNLPDVILDSHSQMNDFFDAFKNFNVDGNIISANGANLKINKSAGHIFKRGVNFNIDNKNPHIITLPESIAPFTIRYRLSDGTEYSNTDSVSLYYENPLGTRIALPSTGYSVQRIIIFPSNLIRIQYGQGVYDTMGLAVSSIYAEDFVYETNIKENGLLRGYLVVKGGITSLLNTDDVKFIEADRFGSMPKGAGSVALGLQDVTETQSNTNVETTFENGLVLDKLRPSEDSISAITINKNDGTTPVIIIDTVSGLTGFGVQPQNKIHTYGLDDSDDDLNSTHKNGITIDGVIGGDKDVIWADNGQNKWYGEIYRHEEGRFWYLYSEEGDISPITVSESGRIGLNSTTNIIDYQPVKIKGLYSGISTNNVFFGGLYNKNFISIYQLEINDSVTIPNTFRWRKSVDDGSTYDDWSDSTGCTTGATIIDSGVEVSFIDVSGFTSGDTWQITAFPQLSPATLSLVANRLNRVFVTYNYTAATPTYFDLSTTVNTTEIEAGFAFPTGTTNTAAFAGGNTKINSIFVNVIQGGLGMTAVVEYWNGSGWVDITVGSDYFVDGTENLTKTGTLSWNISTMTDWEKYDLNNSGDEFYWLRVRTASAPTISPILGGMSRGGNNRFSVYSSAFDTKPSFTIDALGRTSIGGGNIVGKNILQVGNVLSVHESQFESMAQFDSDDSTSAALRLRLSYEGDKGFCLGFGKNRGTAENPAPVQTGDEIGSILWGAAVDDIETGILLGDITTYYTGDNVSRYGDMVFKTHDNSVSPFPTEVMRISGSGNTGFGGITIPTAKIHIQSGSTSVAPFKFNSGQLLTSPQIGAIEFNGTQWYGTVSGDTRKTFAFLESPVFTGTPVIPITTMFDGTNLVDYITNSGGTNNTLLISTTKFNTYTGNTNTRLEDIESDIITVSATTDSKLPTATFNAYTGGTIAWDKVNKTGSDLADLETRNAVDVNYTEPHWGINNVDEALNEVLHYTENFGITGRIEPIDVLFGTRTNTLIVSGGTGYINYEGFHKKITWTGRTFDISGSTTEGVYFVYVNSNSEVNISTSQPNVFENISLGTYYFGGYIGVIQQSGIITTSSSNRVVDSLIRQGIFIYDNGGLIQLLSGSTTKIISPPCKIQYGLIPSNLNEISSNDASTYQFLHYYDSADYKWSLNYHFSVMNQGKIYTNRWNDITKNQVELLTGHTLILLY